MRLIDLEYDYKEKFASNIESEIKRAKTDFEVEVRRIYKEETHRDLPKNLEIISEGSADNEDWSYNFFGLFLGIDDSQYQATKEFVRNAKRETENSHDLKTFAMETLTGK